MPSRTSVELERLLRSRSIRLIFPHHQVLLSSPSPTTVHHLQQILLHQIRPQLRFLRHYLRLKLQPHPQLQVLQQLRFLPLHPRPLLQPTRLFTSTPAASGILSQQQFVLKVPLRAVNALIWVRTTVVEREENRAGGHHAQDQRLPRLLHLPQEEILFVEPLVNLAVVLVLTVESLPTEAASCKGDVLTLTSPSMDLPAAFLLWHLC